MRKVGLIVMIIGFVGAVFSLGADAVGIGKSGIQALQLLGTQLGVLLLAFGWGIFTENRAQNESQPFTLKHHLMVEVAGMPTITWLFAGFFLMYVFLFVSPVFFNDNGRMHYFINYIPDKYPIGIDIKHSIEYVTGWYSTGQSPYADGFYSYPPFFNVFMSVFVLLGYPNVYYVTVFLSLVSFFGIAFSYFLVASKTSALDYSAIAFFLGTGLFSYGTLFELERGQLNLFVMFLTLLAIILFYYRPHFRLLSYLLFSIAIQIKIYPLFLVFMFVQDWKAWKQNIKRLVGLGLFNFVFLFVIGPQEFVNFVVSISGRVNTFFRWVGNHSIYGFVWNLTNSGLGIVSPETAGWLKQYATILQIILMGYTVVCIFLIILKVYRNGEIGLNKHLLVACTIASMLLPSESQDYKLSLLAPIFAILFSDKALLDGLRQRLIGVALVFIAAVAYSAILFPFKYRPDFLQQSTLPLILMLTTTTSLALLKSKGTN